MCMSVYSHPILSTFPFSFFTPMLEWLGALQRVFTCFSDALLLENGVCYSRSIFFFMFDLAMDVIVKQHRELKDHLRYKDHGTKLETSWLVTPSGSRNSGYGIPLS